MTGVGMPNLAVRVKGDDGVVSILYGVRERTLERCSFSAVLRMAKEASSSGRCNRTGVVAGAIIDDDDIINLLF